MSSGASAATIRQAIPSDAEACGRIIHEAFSSIAAAHGFPSDFPEPKDGIGLANAFLNNPSVFGVVAESDGQVLGSNFLDERGPIRGLGPITVDPGHQGKGIGKLLMKAAINRGRDAAGIRLLQDAFNQLSISLYASLGFEVKEPIFLVTGKPEGNLAPGYEVRRLTHDDLGACAELCRRVHGFDRTGELQDAIEHFAPYAAIKGGKMRAYMSTGTSWKLNHGVAETEADMEALFLGASAQCPDPLAFLLPTRQTGFFRWCLGQGFRAIKPMTYMVMGLYQEPAGCYFPNVLY